MPKVQKIRKGVITVAGMGTRFLPATKAMPKEMLPVLDKPVVQYIVEEMADSGVTDIMFVTSSQKGAIEDHFDRDMALERFLSEHGKLDKLEPLIKLTKKVRFSYTRQPAPLGNGDALLYARSFIGDDPFVFSDGDSIIDSKTPVLKQLIRVYRETGASVIGVQKIEDREAMTKYGNVYATPIRSKKRTYKVDKFVEKPSVEYVSPHGLIVGGMRYVFTSDIWKMLESQRPGKDSEVWVSDAANRLAEKKTFYAYEYEGKYFDTGNKLALLNAAIHFAKKEGLL